MMILPGRQGYGAKDVAVVIDNSGSIGGRELGAFFAEVAGILQDVRPKTIWLIHCDTKVNRVDQCSSLDELADLRAKGSPGGGGTSFIPPFEYLKENGIEPECLVYLTDGFGSYPSEPRYPTIWCMTTDQDPPWGEVVRLDIKAEA
jgi:predicted metal-dependent peptidase